jgi:hypothetical protein
MGKEYEIINHKMEKLADKLDVDPEERRGMLLMGSEPPRPSGMHRETYEELIEEWRTLQMRGMQSFYANFIDQTSSNISGGGFSDPDDLEGDLSNR